MVHARSPEKAQLRAVRANALTGPAIFHSAPPLDGTLSFEEDRLRAPARG